MSFLGKKASRKERTVFVKKFGFPYISRKGNPPPRLKYSILSPEQSLEAIKNSKRINQGTRNLLLGLILFGDVSEMPGGVGVYYDKFLKHIYLPRIPRVALQETARELKSQIDIVFLPDVSANIPSGQLGETLGKPLVRIRKGSKEDIKTSLIGFFIDSYTEGGLDFLFIDKSDLEFLNNLLKGNTIRALFTDEIVDCGSMIIAVGKYILGEIKEKGIADIELVEIWTLIKKSFTGCEQRIKEELGIFPQAAVNITDLWFTDNNRIAGMKVEGIDFGLTFFNNLEKAISHYKKLITTNKNVEI